MVKKISLFSLVILMVAAIDNMRNLPAAALFGTSLIFFFLFSALFFLIPTALISAELAATFPKEGGVYQWVNRAFGKKWAMLAIWLQWINTMVWYPTMLSFIAGTLAYLIDPELSQHKPYLITCILTVFWGLTLVNLKGIHVSTRINNIFSTIGMILPMCFLIILGAIWLISGQPLKIHFSADNLVPRLSHAPHWVALVAIMASFLGIELSGVHINDVKNPRKNFPRALFFSAVFIFLSMCFGSLSIAFVLSDNEINLVSGVMQVFSSFFAVFGLKGLIPVMTILLAVGSIGTMINWLISPAKGLLHAAEFGFLPSFFTRKNKAGVAYNILLAQAVLVSLFCLVFLLVPSVNAFYWFLTALSTELYMIMYILLFCSAIYLRYKIPKRSTFMIPGKRWGIGITTCLGLIGCITTIIVSFFPPDYVNLGSYSQYVTMICIGNVLTISPVLLFYLYRRKKEVL